jgi:hypothetical protein
MIMSKEQRTPTPNAVQVAVAVRVEKVSAFAALHKERLPAYGLEGANGGVYAARDYAKRSVKQLN